MPKRRRSDNNNFLRIKYLNKNKEIVEDQTIALPYISASNGAWDDSATWLYGAYNVLPNSLSLDGVTYIDWNIVETGHDIYSGDRDIKLLGFPIQEISPGVNLLGMFFCGALLGLLASTPSKVRATRKNHQMGRTLSSSNR